MNDQDEEVDPKPEPDLTAPNHSVLATHSVLAFDVLDSTNDEARRRAGAGAAAGTVVWALRQEAGRGRRGRRWDSPLGNLYCSLILRPGCAPAAGAQLSLVAALALGEALEACLVGHPRPQLKWPNDVLLEGRKVAGILLESEAAGAEHTAWVVVGVGVNVASFPDGTDYPATSLACEGGAGFSVGEVLQLFLARFQSWYAQWCREGLAPVRAAWLRRAVGLDLPISVRLHGETITGTFSGLDDDGALLLLPVGCGKPRRVSAGDVFFPWLTNPVVLFKDGGVVVAAR